ncbi:MAG: hypothetical protein ACK52I_05210 [Pseudomonadota bacterium]
MKLVVGCVGHRCLGNGHRRRCSLRYIFDNSIAFDNSIELVYSIDRDDRAGSIACAAWKLEHQSVALLAVCIDADSTDPGASTGMVADGYG